MTMEMEMEMELDKVPLKKITMTAIAAMKHGDREDHIDDMMVTVINQVFIMKHIKMKELIDQTKKNAWTNMTFKIKMAMETMSSELQKLCCHNGHDPV